MISIMLDDINSCLPDPLNHLEHSALRSRSVERADTLFRQGDKTRGLFYLVEGAIHLRRVTKAGQEVLMLRA